MLPENIKKACQLAKNPNGCRYVENNEPCCVIAQLYVLDGGDIEKLKRCDNIQYNCITSLLQDDLLELDYPEYFLSQLQNKWDSRDICNNEELLEFAEKLWSEMEEGNA